MPAAAAAAAAALHPVQAVQVELHRVQLLVPVVPAVVHMVDAAVMELLVLVKIPIKLVPARVGDMKVHIQQQVLRVEVGFRLH